MQNLYDLIQNLFAQISSPAVNGPLQQAGIIILNITGFSLIFAVLFKFWQHAQTHPALEKTKTHFFSTREMTALVLILIPFWYRNIGQMPITDDVTQIIYFSLGAFLAIFALTWHIWAKVNIGQLWSDTIEIKQSHPLITTEAYAWARHPMYASLLLWCWGCGLMFYNWITTLIVTGVMLPLMHLRAKAEEENLLAKNPDYQLYQNNVRQLIITTSGKASILIRLGLISILGYFTIANQVTFSHMFFLAALYFYFGHSFLPEKVAFSFRSKAGVMLVVALLTIYVHPAWRYFYFVMMAMSLYGLVGNCPCMLIYEKYHGCPCLKLLKKCRWKGPSK